MSSDVTQSTPNASNGSGKSPVGGWRLVAVGEPVALGMALITFVGAVVVLFIFVGGSLARDSPPAPPVTGKVEDYSALSKFATEEAARQRDKAERRAAMYQSCALLAGVAVAFVAVALFLGAVRREGEASGDGAGAASRLVSFAPGMVAAICAALIIAAAREDSAPAGQGPQLPAPYIAPISGSVG
ncbi:MAG TPA: hypothetical protein VKD72_16120 [Gemmataceae bacterium]|nr:hypothetical protein [Gemmataceae bacterium]